MTLQILSLCKSFHGTPALRDLTFSVEKGDVYGIIGLSGAGKSTLIRCLAGLLSPSSGKILFHGQDLASLDEEDLRSLRRKIGMIFQHFNLFQSRTVAENVAFPLEIAGKGSIRSRVDELLDLVGLAKKRDSYPASLSGGEKQRVGIARALANHPELLLCDEATSALDPKTTQEILLLLKNLQKHLGITIILITHEMEVVKQLCTRVAVMDQGSFVEEGSVAQIFANPQHPMTQQLLQKSSHELPENFLKPSTETRKNLRLKFLGSAAQEPIISEISRRFEVNANILGGWIDHLRATTIGTLVVELSGKAEQIERTLAYFKEKSVHYEQL